MMQVLILTVLYGAETWGLNFREKREIKCNGNGMSEKYVWCDS